MEYIQKFRVSILLGIDILNLAVMYIYIVNCYKNHQYPSAVPNRRRKKRNIPNMFTEKRRGMKMKCFVISPTLLPVNNRRPASMSPTTITTSYRQSSTRHHTSSGHI